MALLSKDMDAELRRLIEGSMCEPALSRPVISTLFPMPFTVRNPDELFFVFSEPATFAAGDEVSITITDFRIVDGQYSQPQRRRSRAMADEPTKPEDGAEGEDKKPPIKPEKAFSGDTVKKFVKVVFTEEEGNQHGKRLAEILQKRIDLDIKLKVYQKDCKAEDAALEEEAIRLKDYIRNGHEYVNKSLTVQRDFKTGKKYYRDPKTGEVVIEEALDPIGDAQIAIDEQGGIVGSGKKKKGDDDASDKPDKSKKRGRKKGPDDADPAMN